MSSEPTGAPVLGGDADDCRPTSMKDVCATVKMENTRLSRANSETTEDFGNHVQSQQFYPSFTPQTMMAGVRLDSKDVKSVVAVVENMEPGSALVDLSKISNSFNGDINEVNRSVALASGSVILHEDGLLVVAAPTVQNARSLTREQCIAILEFLEGPGMTPVRDPAVRIHSVGLKFRITPTQFALSVLAAVAPSMEAVAAVTYRPDVLPCVLVDVLRPPSSGPAGRRNRAPARVGEGWTSGASFFEPPGSARSRGSAVGGRTLRRAAARVRGEVAARACVFPSGDVALTAVSDLSAEFAREVVSGAVMRTAVVESLIRATNGAPPFALALPTPRALVVVEPRRRGGPAAWSRWPR